MIAAKKATPTPGPWTLETVRTSVGICHKIGAFPTGHDVKPISYACVYEDGMGKQVEWDRGQLNSELFANARLIAAAPDLLTALKALVDEVELKDNPSDEGASSGCDQMERARAAIAKADGAK